MRLATIRTPEGTRAVRVDEDALIDLGAEDLGAFLAREDWRDAAASAGEAIGPAADADYAALIPQPSKVVCVGLDDATHITEMGRPLPTHPTLFPKFNDTRGRERSEQLRPEETTEFDLGGRARRRDRQAGAAGLAGRGRGRDRGLHRDERRHVPGLAVPHPGVDPGQELGDATTLVGPVLVTPDELPGGVRPALAISTTVDGEVMQSDTTGDLVFDPVDLVRYVSTMIRLRPGDLIATGTPGGVGHARKPPVYLQVGQTVTCEIEGIGAVTNEVVPG